MNRRLAALGLFVLLLVIAVAVAVARGNSRGPEPENQPAALKITIDNFSFTPREITVAKGTTVIWINHDDVPHTVVNPDKKFKSKALDTDDQFSFTFNESGTFAYFCSVHPMMTGTVTVR